MQDRQDMAVEYRRRLRRQLCDRLEELNIDALTLIELSDLLRVIVPAIERDHARAAPG